MNDLKYSNHESIIGNKNIFFNKIIIIIILILFIINIFYTKKNIEIFEKTTNNKLNFLANNINNVDNNNLLIYRQFEAFFSFLDSLKNESSIYHLIRPKEVMNKKKVRMGSKKDGGYILLNDFENVKIAYSFGLSNEISFDKDLADRNIDVFMYDHTINKLPFTSEKFHWKKIGITENKTENNNMKTLDELIKENGHINERNMILKIDVEGGEWNIFHNLNTENLMQFKYILVEFHFSDKILSIYSKVLKKLNKTHQIFHIHCNNFRPLIDFDGNIICSLFEISYIIRENNTFINSTNYFPIKYIDYKNVINQLDINLFLNAYQINNILNSK